MGQLPHPDYHQAYPPADIVSLIPVYRKNVAQVFEVKGILDLNVLTYFLDHFLLIFFEFVFVNLPCCLDAGELCDASGLNRYQH